MDAVIIRNVDQTIWDKFLLHVVVMIIANQAEDTKPRTKPNNLVPVAIYQEFTAL